MELLLNVLVFNLLLTKEERRIMNGGAKIKKVASPLNALDVTSAGEEGACNSGERCSNHGPSFYL